MAARKRDTGLNETLDALEKKIEQCRVLYELWFNGIEKREPTWHRQDINRQLTRLRRNNQQISSPVDRFRFRNIQARFNALSQYWNRVVLQRERGTYHKDIKRMRRRMGDAEIRVGAAHDEKQRTSDAPEDGVYSLEEEGGGDDLTTSMEEAAAQAMNSQETRTQAQTQVQTGSSSRMAPTVSSPPRPPSSGGGDVSDERMQQIYRTYLKARERTNESTNVSYDAVARSLQQQLPRLRDKGYDDVDFKVVIRDGKAAIRPVAKKKQE